MFGFFKSKEEKEARRLVDIAVRYAAQMNYSFDFSKESIELLELILEEYAQDIEKDTDGTITENQKWSMALIWGAYLGETLRRNAAKPIIWKLDEKTHEVYLTGGKQTEIHPVVKVHKRLINGVEDNVISFYDIGLMMIQNNFSFENLGN